MKTDRINKHISAYSDFLLKAGSSVVREKDKQTNHFDAVNVYYGSIRKIDANPSNTSYSCTALRLARFIIDYFDNKKHRLTKDGSLPDSFYTECSALLKKAKILNVNDNVRLISIKQMMHFMRFAGIVTKEKGHTFIASNDLTDQALYFKLLNAFWDGVDWADVFTSNPDAAVDLHRDKMIFIDLLMHYNDKIEVTALANEFFEMTGFASQGDAFAISFIDFYLLFWLEKFMLINYYDANNKISLELTATGKRLLAFIYN